MSDAETRARVATHLSDARLHHMAGDAAQAETAYRAALALNPDQVNALSHLGRLLMDQRRSAEALSLLEKVAALDARNADARFQLALANINLGKTAPAELWYRACLDIQPRHGAALLNLGVLVGQLGRRIEAETLLTQAVAILPDAPRAHLELGVFLYRRGEHARARAYFRAARALEPVHSVPACTSPAAFSVLFLWSPGVANTPVHYLTEGANFDAHFALILEDGNDLDVLARYGDIVVNLLSDVDHGAEILHAAAKVADRSGKPVLNHPRKIFVTGRDAIAEALAGIPGCRVPRTERRSAAGLTAMPATRTNSRGAMPPTLVRVAGTHGGNDFELFEDYDSLAAFVAARPGKEFYISEYADYRSADGYFRKYRVFLMSGKVLPYHLAVGNQWKLHHFRTDMGSHRWMQDEEERFLRDPASVLTPVHYKALGAIAQRLDLDFCGVDFAIDRDGALVMFEANASMLVQPDDSAFAYKAEINKKVKAAFATTLATAVPHPA